MMASEKGRISFSSWRYSHYFQLESRGKNNISVTCRLCPGSKILSTANNSNSNLLKHLEERHALTKLAAKVANAASETESHNSEHTPTPPKQQRLEFERRTHSLAQLDKTIARGFWMTACSTLLDFAPALVPALTNALWTDPASAFADRMQNESTLTSASVYLPALGHLNKVCCSIMHLRAHASVQLANELRIGGSTDSFPVAVFRSHYLVVR